MKANITFNVCHPRGNFKIIAGSSPYSDDLTLPTALDSSRSRSTTARPSHPRPPLEPIQPKAAKMDCCQQLEQLQASGSTHAAEFRSKGSRWRRWRAAGQSERFARSRFPDVGLPTTTRWRRGLNSCGQQNSYQPDNVKSAPCRHAGGAAEFTTEQIARAYEISADWQLNHQHREYSSTVTRPRRRSRTMGRRSH
ncbi:Uncharacterised protein [Mycobacteroides abscessus subsp. abscessus]|nr:Uncharacterised protein [Mycobacteroides abscessus subsp. abscessus]SHV99224.1 Uncharacterised protein [Mycobacteroides abscessus subsp. abscessus]SIG61331.1 Uncharacterised protein [Mycobacteroides abscessus subsp. abscessus]SIJ28705.1 Uncharacterised protein [Mycobacteroides abscessus subsp. abscessus]SKQ16316.1 Uncharacterised protein [Mycobacteroides abscessus subsp. abscessus]